MMKIYHYIAEIPPRGKKSLGFVPTMGTLHEGHISLLKQSQKNCNQTAVSIYVNSLQFNNKSDFTNYPMSIEQDLEICKRLKVDFVFIPFPIQMPTNNLDLPISLLSIIENLCGKTRKNHFSGVYTIVKKLFEIIQPSHAYFGKKDIQQYLLIKKMVSYLNLNITIHPVDIVREISGLAMSSRNSKLSTQSKKVAANIYQHLKQAAEKIKTENTTPSIISNIITKNLSPIVEKIDYLEIVSCDTLQPVLNFKKKSVIMIAIAVFIEGTRLIDNIEIEL